MYSGLKRFPYVETDIDDGTDVPLVPVNNCIKFRCARAPLVKDSQGFWVCPKCRASYGAKAKG